MLITRSILLVCLGGFCLASCETKPGYDNSKKAEDEIAQAEKDFEKMAAEKGIAEAFWYFADTNAVIKRGNDSLIKGKENIRQFYSSPFYSTATLKWAPDFIESSRDGTMGYAYGKYVFQSRDSAGLPNEFKGVYFTAWKRQPDGNWKFVWD